ncbi:2-hydroxy-acid oxidase [Micromonospora sp. HUAS LYJ1]|uniref:2-hydroxy-acid oxidase n=1 Tax=Micromonospora sp. HUAS LYJ1 TaxID=3061626 RepID=UPI0026722DAF|nr:2-hydroxy-acid oxidase [Micromonospora sp. HUAS LYJ1]WKU04982.1 2-hydroxy-acid oxidase [Micromonospora sp. HUAS LYJ1]
MAAPSTDLHLIRAARRVFTGPAALLHDPDQRARSARYLADLTHPYGLELPDGPAQEALGRSHAEMAETLIGALVPPQEPVDLLVLAFTRHDVLPGRATATYLSHLCPGTPLSFAVCDQGPAAVVSALRLAHAYASPGGGTTALLIAVDQAVLPYRTPTPAPARQQAVAMLCRTTPAAGAVRGPDPADDVVHAPARMTVLRQHADVAADEVAALAGSELAALSAGRPDARMVIGVDLAAAWPAHPTGPVTVAPPAQPVTGPWWTLLDVLAAGPDRTGPVLTADYDPDLRYLCLTGWETTPAGTGSR